MEMKDRINRSQPVFLKGTVCGEYIWVENFWEIFSVSLRRMDFSGGMDSLHSICPE